MLAVEPEQMRGRYRPDLLVREHKLIIELDGHGTHWLVEDRTSGAMRQRYWLGRRDLFLAHALPAEASAGVVG